MTHTPKSQHSITVDQALQQAVAHHQAGRLQEAERLYRAILQTLPKHPDANHNLGVLAVQVKQPAAALPHFKTALEANPNQGQYWSSYIDALIQTGQADAAREVLEQARQRGLSGEAVEVLAGRLEESSANEPSRQEIKTLLALFAEGRYTEAVILAQAMTANFPRHGFGWKALGTVLKQMGRSEDALAAMQKALALLPNDAETHCNLGNALKDMGRFNEAETSYRQALRIKPDYAEAHNNLGNTIKALGRLEEVEACYRSALQVKPNYAEACNNLGVTLYEMGRLEDAELNYHLLKQVG